MCLLQHKAKAKKEKEREIILIVSLEKRGEISYIRRMNYYLKINLYIFLMMCFKKNGQQNHVAAEKTC